MIDRIEALETRVAHQDRTIEELNTTILDLWKQIEALRRQVGRLDDQLREVEAAGGPQGPEPKPPHY
jgi:SlyX protein